MTSLGGCTTYIMVIQVKNKLLNNKIIVFIIFILMYVDKELNNFRMLKV